ncbi:MAG: hypothetical protein LBB36_00145, partial [Fibromonadaceae bacterium]|nr:hypothetical protein [Fibromonadaceae bacterium]
MKKPMKFIVTLAAVALTAMVFISCGSSKIPIQVQRTPNLNTKGIQRIAVMPFTGNYIEATQHATNVATGNIQATNQFTLVSAGRIKEARKKGENLENYADALFIGQITNIEEKKDSQTSSWTDKKGVTHTQTTYTLEVSVNLTYHLERTRDGSMIGPVVKKGSTSASANSPNELPSINTLVNNVVESQLRSLYMDLVPHTVTVQRTMEKEPNSALKPQMEAALEQLKAGNYVIANKQYLALWESHQSFAAALNASYLYEAMGETQNAANLMQQVFAATGNPKAKVVLDYLNRDLAEQAAVEQFSNAQNQTEIVTGFAIGEVQKVLPAEAKLWIHNSAASEQNLVNDIIDNMISKYLSSGVTIVERQVIDMVFKEQNLQTGGSVSDDDIVRIGNLAGANTI